MPFVANPDFTSKLGGKRKSDKEAKMNIIVTTRSRGGNANKKMPKYRILITFAKDRRRNSNKIIFSHEDWTSGQNLRIRN